MKYAVRGNTFPIRMQLSRLRCKWEAYFKCWITEDAELKKHLRVLEVDPKLIARIHLEKISEK